MVTHVDAHKVWVVTGASTGLGLSLVRCVLARGDCAIATARSIDNLNTALSGISLDERERLRILCLDVLAGSSELQSVARTAIAFWGRVDVVVNNAGILYGLSASEEVGPLHFAQMLATNLFGAIEVTNSFLPHLRKRREGTIIIIGSRSAFRTEQFGPSAYSVSKAAVHAYGESLSAELRPFNIRVTIAAPGTMKSSDSFNAPTLAPARFKDYDNARAALANFVIALRDRPDTQRGDPYKAMDVVVDLVRGDGRAKGRKWPLWLLLGDDAVADWQARMRKMSEAADEWGDVAIGLAHNQEVG